MKRYVIERDLPAAGSLDRVQLKDAAATSNAALAQLSGKVQWLQSFVAEDKPSAFTSPTARHRSRSTRS